MELAYLIFGALWAISFIFICLLLKYDIDYHEKQNKKADEKTIYPTTGSIKIIWKKK